MFKANKRHILLLVIFAFAFGHRISLMFRQTYPPSADIGVHASVINSITNPDNTNLLWNYYQMGGGETLAFPGYHIFASIIITMTGMPNYLAQAIIAALFSALIVLATFLVTRIVLSESVALIAAFFVSLSWLDLEILSWGGYPNITALLLIPLTFYLFLKRDTIKLKPFLVSASMLVASLFLTHSLSVAVFVGITGVSCLAVLVFPKTFNESRKTIIYWALPIVIGAILVSPFLANAAPLYLNESATLTGNTAIEQALIAERMVPLDVVLVLFACIMPFFFVSKAYKGRFFSLSVFLLVMWLLVPLLLTQGYLVGLYVDYVRFQYFLILPVIILLAVITEWAPRYFTKAVGAYCGLNGQNPFHGEPRLRFSSRINSKTLWVAFQAGILLVSLFYLPIFLVPWKCGINQRYYQVMNDKGYQAIEWVEQNTPVNSVFVSDHYYGWWITGFSQRPTITAVDLHYLTLAREVNIAKNASYMLDTDYLIDNGYIQVREDGGYIGRHNPLFLVNVNETNSPYGVFQFNSSEITMIYSKYNNTESITAAELPVTDMQLFDANSDSPYIIVNKANSDLSFLEIITVTKGQLFANMTIIVQSKNPNVSLGKLNFVISSKGKFQHAFNNTVSTYNSTVNVCGQLKFEQPQPKISNISPQNPCTTQLSYNLQGKSEVEIQILVGTCAVSKIDSKNPTSSLGFETLSANLENRITLPDLPITTFDYKVAIQQYNVSYVANRDFELNPKYANDPEFSLAFINSEVTIFRVETNTTSAKR